MAYLITGHGLTPSHLVEFARSRPVVALGVDARAEMDRRHQLMTEAAQRKPVYGRSTGVGANRDLAAPDAKHGERLLASHATTSGEHYPDEVVRAAVLIRLNQMALGGSGLPSSVADALIDMVNRDDLPTLHRGGALGIGDIGPLAELGRALGAVLGGPDTLALLSSNAITLAECCLIAEQARAVLDVVPFVAALTFAALRGNPEAFDAQVEAARPHAGQARVAARMRELVAGLPMEPAQVQDPFGLRALAQVVGPAYESMEELVRVLEVELNAATESPLVSEDGVVHHGNWHAMPVALRMDALRLALHGVATLSASRLGNLMDPGLTGLSRFLASGPPASSGAMLLEYVAQDALVSLRLAAQPATLSTVSLSRGVENHASFAPHSVQLAAHLLPSLRTVLACELVAACRAVALAGWSPSDLRPAEVASRLADALAVLPADLADRPLRADIEMACGLFDQWGGGPKARHGGHHGPIHPGTTSH